MHRLTAAYVLLLSTPLLAQQPEFFFRQGDRVCFLGDSITEQYQYSSYIELYLTTRFPSWKLTFVNAGISGDTARGGATRFANHVLAERPTCVTIDFGMNDGGYGAFDDQRHTTYIRNTEAMLDAAKKAGVRVALISPNAVEVRNKPNLKQYLETQKQFYRPLQEIAGKFAVPFVDQYAITRTILEKVEADQAGVKPFPDGVHTSPAGGLLMARTILVGLKAPALVSDATIDVATSKGDGKRCAIKILESSPSSVAFERTDEALPLPVQKEWRDLLPYIDQMKDLNYYGLKVTGLADGRYAILVDGQEIGTASRDDLAAGVNLGNYTSGPLFDQGQQVFAAINAKNRDVHDRFRKVVMFDPKSIPAWVGDVSAKRTEELQKRDRTIADLQDKVNALARPVPHKFELKPAK